MSDALDFDAVLRADLEAYGYAVDPGSKPVRWLTPDGRKLTFDEAVRELQSGTAKRLWEKSQKTGL